MKKQLSPILLILLLSLSLACHKKQAPSQSSNKQSSETAIDELVERYLELGRFSGSILITNQQDINYHKHFGFSNHQSQLPFTKATTFKIGSLSRLFAQKIIQDLVQANKISLDQKLSAYLDDYKEELTIKDLLNEKMLTKTNAVLIERLMQTITGNSFSTDLAALSKKLKLQNTHYKSKVSSSAKATGHLYTYQGNEVSWSAAPVAPIDSLSIMTGIESTSEDILVLLKNLDQKSYQMDDYMANDGFSYAIHNDNDLSIIILSNNRHPVAKEMAQSIQAILAGQSYSLPLARKAIEIDPKLLQNYAGAYAINPNFNLQIVAESGALFALMGPNKMPLIPQSENQFYMENSDAGIRFIRNPNGMVDKAVMLDGFMDGMEVEKVME